MAEQSELMKRMVEIAKAAGNTRNSDEESAFARLLQSNRTPARSNAEAVGRGIRELILPGIISEINAQIKTRNDRNSAQKTKDELDRYYGEKVLQGGKIPGGVADRIAEKRPDIANIPVRMQQGGNDNFNNLPEVGTPFQSPAPAPANGFNRAFDQAIADTAPNLSPQNIGGLFGAVQGAAPPTENLGTDALESLKSLGENERLKKLLGNWFGGGGF